MSDTQTTAARSGYDADAKAKARTDAPVTIGGETFHMRRRNWPVTLELRKVTRQQDRTLAKVRRLERERERLADDQVTKPAEGETREAFEDRIDARVEQIDEQIDELVVELDELAYEYAATGLHPAGAGPDEHADIDFLKRHLAAEEVGELVGRIAGAAEERPTTTATEGSTTTT